MLYSVLSTPETGGLVCQFQHPTLSFLNINFGGVSAIPITIGINTYYISIFVSRLPFASG
jgi:hypothetical protein